MARIKAPALTDFQKWKRWDRANPEFYTLFTQFANEAVAAGVEKISGWWIANRIRWETSVVTRGSDYKVPNGCIAYYTRLFVEEYPQHEGLFEMRPLKTPLEKGDIEDFLYQRAGLA